MNNNKLSYDLVIERISTGVYDVKYSEPKLLLNIEVYKDCKKT